jgi:hypothetical protein
LNEKIQAYRRKIKIYWKQKNTTRKREIFKQRDSTIIKKKETLRQRNAKLRERRAELKKKTFSEKNVMMRERKIYGKQG